MIGKQTMTLVLTAGLAILSTVLYNLFQKMTPVNANPALALTVTYTIALCTTLLLFGIFPASGGLGATFQKLNWVSFALGLAIAGVEVGTLLAFRAGWQLSLLPIVVNVTASLILVTLGIVLFRERLSLVNVLGILVCLAGLVMINLKR